MDNDQQKRTQALNIGRGYVSAGRIPGEVQKVIEAKQRYTDTLFHLMYTMDSAKRVLTPEHIDDLLIDLNEEEKNRVLRINKT